MYDFKIIMIDHMAVIDTMFCNSRTFIPINYGFSMFFYSVGQKPSRLSYVYGLITFTANLV